MEYPAGCPGAQVWVKPSEATPTGYALPARFPAQLPRAGAATQSARAGAGAPPQGEKTANEIAQVARARHGPLHPGPAPRRGTHGEARRWAGPSGGASGRWESRVALLAVAHAACTLCRGTWRIWKVGIVPSRLLWLFSRLGPALLRRRSWVRGRRRSRSSPLAPVAPRGSGRC